MEFKFKRGEWKGRPEDMTGFHIWCFTCNEKVQSKSEVRGHHLNHEVDWIRDNDGARHALMSDKEITLKP